MNMKPTRIHFLAALISISVPLLVGGCSGESTEEIGSASQAFGETSCGSSTLTPDDTIVDDGTVTSPTTYSNSDCFKAFCVDFTPLLLSSTGLVDAEWADSVPSSQAACEALWMASDVYLQIGSNWSILNVQARSGNGVWGPVLPGGPSLCTGPSYDWTSTQLSSGANYRICTTARTSNSGSAPTRAFSLTAFDTFP